MWQAAPQQHQRSFFIGSISSHRRQTVLQEYKMALAVKWSAAFIIVVLLVLQLVCCSRHSPDVRDDDGDDSRHGAVPRYSSPARRQSTYVYTSYFALVGERSIAISLSVCLCVCVSVCTRAYLWNRWTDLHEIPCGRGSVLIWRRCDTLCTSVFMDYVTFGRNGPYDDACLPLAALSYRGGV